VTALEASTSTKHFERLLKMCRRAAIPAARLLCLAAPLAARLLHLGMQGPPQPVVVGSDTFAANPVTVQDDTGANQTATALEADRK
jgi:hypothetical protein